MVWTEEEEEKEEEEEEEEELRVTKRLNITVRLLLYITVITILKEEAV